MFTVCSTPEGTCAKFEPDLAPFGPPKCECVLGFVRHQGRCIHHTDCPGYLPLNATVSTNSVSPPEDCPEDFNILSDNTVFSSTATATINGTASLCWLGHLDTCPERHLHCLVGANYSRSVCCPFTFQNGVQKRKWKKTKTLNLATRVS